MEKVNNLCFRIIFFDKHRRGAPSKKKLSKKKCQKMKKYPHTKPNHRDTSERHIDRAQLLYTVGNILGRAPQRRVALARSWWGGHVIPP